MATPFQVLVNPFAGSVDAANDTIPYWQNSGSAAFSITRNKFLNLASQPLGLTDTQSPTNKTFNNTNAFTVKDGSFTLNNTADTSKVGVFSLANVTTATTRTYTFPNASVILASLTGTETLTNKTITSPAITGGSLDNATVTVDTVSGHTTSNTGTIYGIAVTTGTIGSAALAANAVTTTAITDGNVTAPKVANGFVVQVVSTNFSAVATGTTVLPFDDTIPQSTEGDQYITQAITPKSATNHLLIEATLQLSNSAGPNDLSAALFQDATANALAASDVTLSTNTYMYRVTVSHDMVAGTTSSTTFKIRAGASGAGTTTFNGQGGARRFGGITLSNIKITEYKA